MDFLLDHAGSGYRSLVRDFATGGDNLPSGANNSFFKKNGKNDISRFLNQYLPWYGRTKNAGYISLITGNHDTPRISAGLDQKELALSLALFLTFPGVPFIYYGDEIGMRYINDLPTKEGGYTRTGTRTPMQWDGSENKGFSSAPKGKLYLPVDSQPGAPDVEAQKKDPASLYNTVRKLLSLRHAETDLQAEPNLEIIYGEKEKLPFVYRRGAFILALNPGGSPASVSLHNLAESAGPGKSEAVFCIGGAAFENGICRLEAQSFGIWKTKV
jgi:maltose alpha-D-glucosyltransferase/alpha-amylase